MMTFVLYLILGIVSLSWSAALALKGGRCSSVRRSFALVEFSFALALIAYAFNFLPDLRDSHAVNMLIVIPSLTFSSFYFLFIRSLTSVHGVRPVDLLAFVPAMVVAAIVLTSGMNVTRESESAYVFWYLLVSGVFVLADGIFSHYHFQRRLFNYFTSDNGLALEGGKVSILISAIMFTFGAAALLVPHFMRDIIWVDAVVVLASCLIQCTLCYSVMRICFSAKELSSGTFSTDAITSESYKHVVDSMVYAMETRQTYLDQNLTIESLSREIGTDPATLLRVYRLNNLNKSFADFVNDYRIRYAQELMVSNAGHVRMKDVARLSGFVNLSAFNANFERVTGQMPCRWMRTHLNGSTC